MDQPAGFLSETLVLIPALNEAECIAETVQDWLVLGASRVRVADNGSTDRTACRARRAGAEVVHQPRRGYGAAAWRGLQDWPEECRWVLFSSADGSDRLSAREATAWQEAVDAGYEMVLGNRTSRVDSRAQLNRLQRFGNRVCCLAMAAGWKHRFHDMGSLRLVRRASLMRLNLRDRAFGWNVEMQVRAVELGLRIVELPVRYFPRRGGQSKISGNLAGSVKAGWGIVGMLAYLWRLRRTRDNRLAHVAAPQIQ